MTLEQLKVIISADDSQFNKAIKGVKQSLNNLDAKGLIRSLDAVDSSTAKMEKSFRIAYDSIYKESTVAASRMKETWLNQIEQMISIAELKLKSLSKSFEQSGYSDYWGTQIDSADSYLRTLKKLREEVANGGIDVQTTDIETAFSNIADGNDIKVQATVEVENGQLKETQGIIKAIEESLDEIDKLKLKPVTHENLTLIKEYKKVIDSLASQLAKVNKEPATLKWNTLKRISPETYERTQKAFDSTKPSDRLKKVEKLGGTITRAMIGVRSLFFFVRKIVSQNENMTNAVNLMFEAIAGTLKPVLDFIASLIAGLALILGRLFKVDIGIKANTGAGAAAAEKQLTLARFDELEVLNRSREGGGGVSAGYSDWLDKIDRKLQKIYDLIDKIRGTVDKADLPNSDDTVEGIIASGAAGSQSPSGIGFSIGTNKDNEQIEAVYEAWEDAKVDWVMKQLEKIKQGYRNLKESIKLQNEEIAQNTIEETDAQVEKWYAFSDRVKTIWEGAKEIYNQNLDAETQATIDETNAQIEAWNNFKTKVSTIWDNVKTKFHDTWENIRIKASEVWENIKTKCITAFDNVKTKVSESIDNIKSFFTGIPTALKNAMNSVIGWVENGINNIINKINNSGLMTVLNRVFNGGLWVNPIWIPRLASGGVLSTPTVAQLGEYPGARSNPEIAAPQSILKETIDASNDELASVYIQIGRQIIDAINNKDMEVSINDTTIAKSAARGNRSYQLATGQSLF